MVSMGNFVYLIGGSENATNAVGAATVMRAEILSNSHAPQISSVAQTTDGGLVAGHYYYTVSAILGAGEISAGEETPPGAIKSISISDPLGADVTLSWSAPAGYTVSGYRVYRSASGSPVVTDLALIADNIPPTTTQLIDDGTLGITPATLPKPAGSLGPWVTLANELLTPRFDAAAAVVEISGDSFLHVTGGRTAVAGVPLASTEWASLDSNSADIGPWQAGPNLLTPRAEHSLLALSTKVSTQIPVGAEQLIVIAGSGDGRDVGTPPTGLSSMEISALGATGAPVGWSGLGTLAEPRVGLSALIHLGRLYVVGGWLGQSSDLAGDSEFAGSALNCAGGTPCTVSFGALLTEDLTLTDAGRFRGHAFSMGPYIFLVGGANDVAAVDTTRSTTRLGYQ
jgi:hypothetical protein